MTAALRDLTLSERLLLVAGTILFIVCNCGVLTAEVLPIKPRDGNLAIVGMCALLLLLCRKFYCAPMLLLLALPLWRIADAAFLQRFTMHEMESHMAGVINLASPMLVVITMMMIYSTRVGRYISIIGSVGLILVIAASNLYEWLGFAHWTTVSGRMAGFHLHPNTGPTYSLLCLSILFTLNKRFWMNLTLAGVAMIPTMLSISRSCVLMWFAVVGIYVMLNFRAHFKGLLAIILFTPPLLGAWVAAVEASASHGRLRKDEFTEGRFEAIFRGDLNGLKSAERGKDLADGWAAVGKEPVWGYGPGCACGARWQPHNQIVSVWLEVGFLGAVLYLVTLLMPLVVAIWKRFPGGGAWCLLPAFLNIPCQQWLLEMPPYLFALAVCYGELFPHRYTFVAKPADDHSSLPAPNAWQQVT